MCLQKKKDKSRRKELATEKKKAIKDLELIQAIKVTHLQHVTYPLASFCVSLFSAEVSDYKEKEMMGRTSII